MGRITQGPRPGVALCPLNVKGIPYKSLKSHIFSFMGNLESSEVFFLFFFFKAKQNPEFSFLVKSIPKRIEAIKM